jgi:hypothetical protein
MTILLYTCDHITVVALSRVCEPSSALSDSGSSKDNELQEILSKVRVILLIKKFLTF